MKLIGGPAHGKEYPSREGTECVHVPIMTQQAVSEWKWQPSEEVSDYAVAEYRIITQHPSVTPLEPGLYFVGFVGMKFHES